MVFKLIERTRFNQKGLFCTEKHEMLEITRNCIDTNPINIVTLLLQYQFLNFFHTIGKPFVQWFIQIVYNS